MRGILEIYDGDDLLYSQDNMIVDGGGALLADMMTVSPSLSGIPSASAILDSSNYTVQALAFGKDEAAFQKNAHEIPNDRNLFMWSTPSSTDLTWVSDNGVTLSSTPEITNPPGYESVPSSVAHVIAVIDDSTTANESLAQQIYMKSTNADAVASVSAGQDNWFCYSMYIKPCVPGYPHIPYWEIPFGSNYNSTHFKMQLQGANYTAGNTTPSLAGVGKSRASADPKWDMNSCSMSSLGFGFTGDSRGSGGDAGGGYSVDQWDSNAGCEDVGDGWYLVWTAAMAPVSGLSSISTSFWNAGYDSGGGTLGDTSGGMYSFGSQVELGRWPSARDFKNGGAPNNWAFSGTVLNRDHSPGGPQDEGTVRVVGDYSNRNLLAYTVNPHYDPAYRDPAGIAGTYWTRNQDQLGCFSATTATSNPFGGTSSLILSASDFVTTSSVNGLIGRQGKLGWNPDDTALTGVKDASIPCPGCWKVDETSIFSVYVKCASTVAGYTTTSSFMLGQQMGGTQANQYTTYIWNGAGVPEEKLALTNYPARSTGVHSVGNNWYRIQNRVLGWGIRSDSDGIYGFPTSSVEGTRKGVQIYMGDWAGDVAHLDMSGASMFYYAPQLEVHPNHLNMSATEYGENYSTGIDPSSFTPLSSYVPYNGISSPPNPASTRLEDKNTDILSTSSNLSGFNEGHNLNMIPFRQQRTGYDKQFFDAWGGTDAAGKRRYKKTWVDGGTEQLLAFAKSTASYPLSGAGQLGPQAYYEGCYPEGSSNGGSTWAIVSSLESSAAYEVNNVKGTYYSIFNEASSMDASGFVGKVYDTMHHKVGGIPNPNHLNYTDDPGGSPGINNAPESSTGSGTDINGTFWTGTKGKIATFSSVLETNPFGGPSSILLSGTSGGGGANEAYSGNGRGYGLLAATTSKTRVPVIPSTSSLSYIQSIYVKRPSLGGFEASSFMLKVKDTSAPSEGYSTWFEFKDNGTVPTVFHQNDGVRSRIEPAGNGWYRCQNIIDCSSMTTDTTQGDTIGTYYYLGNSSSTMSPEAAQGKCLLFYAPQMETYDQTLGFSATAYQEVSQDYPTVGENAGSGGLYVSSQPGFSSIGEVIYEATLGSGDVGYSNLYGGITNLGLYTIDVNQSIREGNPPPYSFGPLNNPRRYRLLATKALSRNLGYVNDAWPNAGAHNYKDLKIRWRLRFV